MRSNGGIAIRRKDDGKYEASIFVSHDIENKEMAKFVGEPMDAADFAAMPEKNVVNEEGIVTEKGKESVGFMSQLHLRLLLFAFDKRDNIGIKGCRKLANFEGKFGHPLKFNCNPDGSIMLGKNPTKYWKVFLMGNPEGKCRKANFSMPVPISEENPDGELVMDWCFLQEVELVFKPLLTFKSLYSGGDKIYIISEISSGVIISFTPINNACLQTITLNKLREDPSLLQSLQEQLAKAKETIAKNGKPTLKLTEIVEKKDEDGEKKTKGGNSLKFEEDDEPKNKKSSKKSKDEEEDDEPKNKKSSKKDVVIDIDDEPKKNSKKATDEDGEVTLKKPNKLKKAKDVEEDGATELA
jgi:hypothetical protein